jgi:hypothetical protein
MVRMYTISQQANKTANVKSNPVSGDPLDPQLKPHPGERGKGVSRAPPANHSRPANCISLPACAQLVRRPRASKLATRQPESCFRSTQTNLNQPRERESNETNIQLSLPRAAAPPAARIHFELRPSPPRLRARPSAREPLSFCALGINSHPRC